jgi:hypothetical protein
MAGLFSWLDCRFDSQWLPKFRGPTNSGVRIFTQTLVGKHLKTLLPHGHQFGTRLAFLATSSSTIRQLKLTK